MISFVKGNVDIVLENSVIIDCNDIGYNVFTTKSTLSSLSGYVKLYTYMHVLENKITLYGFKDIEETKFFETVTTVSGVGPKSALGLLNISSPKNLASAIIAEDVNEIKQAPGIGLKTAQRIILELKSKISNQLTSNNLGMVTDAPLNDAYEALLALGYSPKIVYSTVSKISKDTFSTEEIIKLSLKELSGV